MSTVDAYLKSEIDKAKAVQINAEMLALLKDLNHAIDVLGYELPFELQDRIRAIAKAPR